jgi:hypothetical protein
MSASPAISESSPPKLEALFLETLRRDSFVMEVSAYRQPSMPDPSSFAEIYGAFNRQVCAALRGSPYFCVSGIQIQPSAAFDGRAKVLPGPQICCSTGNSDYEPLSFDSSGRCVIEWIVNTAPTLSNCAAGLRESYASLVEKPTKRILVPYIVMPSLAAPLPSSFNEILRLRRTLGANISSFVYTQPLALIDPFPVNRFTDAYYKAALLVIVEDKAEITAELLDRLEAIHIGFQLSWGFPALSAQRAHVEAREREHDLRNEHFNELLHVRALAQSLTVLLRDKVQPVSDRILASVNRDTPFDNTAALLKAFALDGDPLWSENGMTVLSLHRPSSDDETNRRWLGFTILRLLGQDPSPSVRNVADLFQQVRDYVSAQYSSDPFPESLLLRILNGNVPLVMNNQDISTSHKSHQFLRYAVYEMVAPGSSPLLYCLALRLFLTNVGPSFSVVILTDPTNVTIKKEDLLDSTSEAALNDSAPRFPLLPEVSHKQWIQPFVHLIGNALQTTDSKNKVWVNGVQLFKNPYGAHVVCQLQSRSPDSLANVKATFKAQQEAAYTNGVGPAERHDLASACYRFFSSLREAKLIDRITLHVTDDTITLKVAARTLKADATK